MRTKISPDEARQKQRDQIAEAAEKLRSTEGWKQWLKARRSFHTYSFRNQMLIALQRPDATAVRGFRQWRDDFNRQVQKGSKAIYILAPMTKKILDKQTGETEQKLFFRSVKVFDVADTRPIEGAEEIPISPPGAENVEGDSHEWAIRPLVEFIEAELEREVIVSCQNETAEGYCTDDHIAYREDLVPNRAVRVLVHEISHALGVSYTDYGRPVAESICDTVAYCVCDTIGLDVSGATVPYVATWDSASTETLTKWASLIDKNAKRIEEVLIA